MPSPCGRRCLLVACVAYGLFANHWARDSLGALEVPLESDAPYSLSARRYNALTSLYFLPNIGVPILAGVLAHRFGAAATYAAFFAIAAAGNGLVGASVAAGGGGGADADTDADAEVREISELVAEIEGRIEELVGHVGGV
mmetsp:Transcript_1523/g.4844  ORF Transcript_1523/g.4844 Transcript_1523/m.4844 type:complete len:141 (+) Transcript_1523:140-562(+)